ncbi:hypothetical protein FRB90_001543, partial [Tulasnella sp. 427]
PTPSSPNPGVILVQSLLQAQAAAKSLDDRTLSRTLQPRPTPGDRREEAVATNPRAKVSDVLTWAVKNEKRKAWGKEALAAAESKAEQQANTPNGAGASVANAPPGQV